MYVIVRSTERDQYEANAKNLHCYKCKIQFNII